MIARNHEACAWAAWSALAPTAAVVLALALDGHRLELLAYLLLGLVCAGAGVGPDLDKPAEGGHPGATATETHPYIGRAVGEVVSHVCGGHRSRRHWWSTHRYSCGLAVGALVTVVALLAPRPTLAAALAICGAWVLYIVLPWRGPRRAWLGSRDSAWALALGGSAVAFLPMIGETAWTGAAVGLGWCAHIFCDRLQSRCFELGGVAEKAIAAVSVAGALVVVALQVRPALPF